MAGAQAAGLQGAAARYGRAVDALQTKEGKAVVFTRGWLLYLDVRRRRLRWAMKLNRLTTTSTHGAPPDRLPEIVQGLLSSCQSSLFVLFLGSNGQGTASIKPLD